MDEQNRLVPIGPIFYSSLHSAEDEKYFPPFYHTVLHSSNVRAKWADDYFSRLKTIHNLLKMTDNKVAIAMIDTGINVHHPEMKMHIQNGSITLWKGFPEELNPLEDNCGHGTHGASVLLKTAPNAELLMARVFDDNGKMPYKDKYPDVVEVHSIHRHSHS